MRCVGHIGDGNMTETYKILIWKLKRDHLGDLGIDEMIILKWILESLGVKVDRIKLVHCRVQWQSCGQIPVALW